MTTLVHYATSWDCVYLFHSLCGLLFGTVLSVRKRRPHQLWVDTVSDLSRCLKHLRL